MSNIFIRPEFRPDLRAAMADVAGRGTLPSVPSEDLCLPSLPIPYLCAHCSVALFKGCGGEKSDKADKKVEVGKDDKARVPVQERASLTPEGSIASDSPARSAYPTIFA
jgi:hypothetical protein